MTQAPRSTAAGVGEEIAAVPAEEVAAATRMAAGCITAAPRTKVGTRAAATPAVATVAVATDVAAVVIERRGAPMRGIFILLSLVAVFSLRAAEPSPPVYAFRYATFYRTDPKIDPEYLIVGEGALAFRNLDDFRKFLATLPVGATVTWRSRCTMRDPFLASEHDIAALATFCKIRGIQFIHLPAG